MKYSKEQLEAMSNLQLSMAILQLSNNGFLFATRDTDSHAGLVLIDQSDVVYLDINNPNDIMPLAFAVGISLISSGGGWYTAHSEDLDVATLKCSHECYCVKPLRAAAIVYILVMQGS